MNTSLFSKLGWQGQPNFEKREIGGGGGLPRAAAPAALPWADMLLPFQGVRPSGRKANKSLEATRGFVLDLFIRFLVIACGLFPRASAGALDGTRARELCIES